MRERLSPSPTTSRSTITSIECFLYLSSNLTCSEGRGSRRRRGRGRNLFAQVIEDALVFAFAVAYHRGHDHDLALIRQLLHRFYDLLDALHRDLPSALGTMGMPHLAKSKRR